MKTQITLHYVLMFSYELRKGDWDLCDHDYCITAHNIYEDMQIVIPKKLNEYSTIDLWCSGTLLDSFGTITMLDMYLKGLLYTIK